MASRQRGDWSLGGEDKATREEEAGGWVDAKRQPGLGFVRRKLEDGTMQLSGNGKEEEARGWKRREEREHAGNRIQSLEELGNFEAEGRFNDLRNGI